MDTSLEISKRLACSAFRPNPKIPRVLSSCTRHSFHFSSMVAYNRSLRNIIRGNISTLVLTSWSEFFFSYITSIKSGWPGKPTVARKRTMFVCFIDERNLASEAKSSIASLRTSSLSESRNRLTAKRAWPSCMQ